MTATKLALLVLGTLGLTGCVHGEDEGGRPDAARSGPVSVSQARTLDVHYVAGDELHRPGRSEPIELAAAVNTTLIGNLAPAAVPTPDGRLLAYNAWRGRRPVVRLRDLSTGDDVVLEDGGLSIARRSDGALATVRSLAGVVTDVRRYVGHVLVRASPEVSPEVWTRIPGRYVVAAWAGNRLLVYRLRKGWPDLLVLDGPRRARVLAKAGALVAVSPDGTRAFVSSYGASPPVVRVLDLASGSELALRTVTAVRWLNESGSWAGDLVAATASSGVVVFRVRARSIALEQVLRFDAAGFTVGPFEPRLEAAGSRVVGWAELASRPRQALAEAAVLVCGRAQRRCIQGPPVSSRVGLRLVYDPSRP